MTDKPVHFASSGEEPYPLQVVGESYHHDEIESLFGYIDVEEGVNDDDFVAVLIPDNNNLNDPEAIRIEIEGNIVGYLSRPTAKIYRRKLEELGIPNEIGICSASIRGGFLQKETNEPAEFGIRLDIDLNNLLIEKSSPTPPNNIQTKKQSIAQISTQPKKEGSTLRGFLILIILIFVCFCFIMLTNHK
jgi:hypothetical protein